jgi:ESX secretion system protein EccD
MPDDRCRITVIGDRHQADVAVPAWAPVGEYAAALARLCGQETHDALPPAWSLALAGAAPVPLERSLAQAGVLDGQRLYLRDIAQGEADEPVVSDIAEMVSDASHRRGRLSLAGRAATALTLGLAWLTAAAVYLVAGGAATKVGGAAGALVAAGLLLPSAVWVLRRRETQLPGPLCAALALGAVPCLAGAGALLGPTLGAGSAEALVTACGASLGALTALAAVPEELTLAAQLLTVAAAVAAGALTAWHSGSVRAAAVVALLAAVLAALAPRAAALLAGMSISSSSSAALDHDLVQDTVTRTLRLLPVLTIAAAVALVPCLVILARAPGLYGPALAAAISAALLARAAGATLAGHLIPLAAAGTAGLFAVLAFIPDRMLVTAEAAPVLVVIGVLIVMAAVGTTLVAGPGPLPSTTGDADRHAWPEIAGLVLNLATVPLALGLFGVLHQILVLGRHL